MLWSTLISHEVHSLRQLDDIDADISYSALKSLLEVHVWSVSWHLAESC